MKTIQLIRHAKSSWEDSRLSDLQRPLNPRGYRDCQLMGPAIESIGCNLNPVYCSPAQRAQLTINHLAAAMTETELTWQVVDALYTFSGTDLSDWIIQLDNSSHHVTLVGHNPAMTQLINDLSGAGLENFPTCAFAQLTLATDNWSALTDQTADLQHFLKPKFFR